MDTCDVLIVGGGPAGSSCAWKLREAGLDIVVADAAVFPRDKVCAGWITPQVIAELALDTNTYRQGRTFQPITGFAIGVIGSQPEIDTTYGRAVSFAIRRCEFDQYLLQRSGARVIAGMPVTRIRRSHGGWLVNDALRAPMLVGAGGHFCPVARALNGSTNRAPLVVAQEAEFPIEAMGASSVGTEAERPELYFSPDLKGYGWCVRKGAYLNVGLGRLDRRSLPAATAAFVAFLKAKGKVTRPAWRWKGHAYSLYDPSHRQVVDTGVLLVGDAAGLAYPQSGEGIRPAIESGLMAAATILEANGQYTRERLRAYEQRLRARFGSARSPSILSRLVPSAVATALGNRLLGVPPFVRHVVLDRWFLHAQEPALTLRP